MTGLVDRSLRTKSQSIEHRLSTQRSLFSHGTKIGDFAGYVWNDLLSAVC